MDTQEIFEIEQVDDVVIVTVCSEIGNFSCADAMSELDTEVAQRHASASLSAVLVDFSNVDYFGSMMLETLRHIWMTVRDSGGKLAICGCNPVCHEVFELSHFTSIWSIYETQEEALANLKGE